MVKERMPYDPEQFKLHAERVAYMSTMLVEAFRPDTRGAVVETEALDNIWEDFGEFERLAGAMREKADALYAVRADLLEVFRRDPAELRRRSLIAAYPWDVEGMWYRGGDRVLRVARGPAGWHWENGAPIPGATPDRVARAATELSAVAFHDDAGPIEPTGGELVLVLTDGVRTVTLGDSGVVHEHVKPAEGLVRLFHGPDDVGLVGYVRTEELHVTLAVHLGQIAEGLLPCLFIQIHERYPVPPGQEPKADGLPDALGTACDQSGLDRAIIKRPKEGTSWGRWLAERRKRRCFRESGLLARKRVRRRAARTPADRSRSGIG